MADRIAPDEWELSGVPARQGTELTIHNSFVKTIEGTTVTVTKEEP